MPIAVDMLGRAPPPLYAADTPFSGGALPPAASAHPRFSAAAGYPQFLSGAPFAPSPLPPMPLYARRPMRGAISKDSRAPPPPEDDDDWVPDTRVGRQRVMTKCPQCGHSNHIRRKICQNCQAPKPPPAKRKRRRRRKSHARRAAASASAHAGLGALGGPGLGISFPSAVSLQPLSAPPPPPLPMHAPPLDPTAALVAARARALLAPPQLQPLHGPAPPFDTAHASLPRAPPRDR